jgi:hypothetical protein
MLEAALTTPRPVAPPSPHALLVLIGGGHHARRAHASRKVAKDPSHAAVFWDSVDPCYCQQDGTGKLLQRSLVSRDEESVHNLRVRLARLEIITCQRLQAEEGSRCLLKVPCLQIKLAEIASSLAMSRDKLECLVVVTFSPRNIRLRSLAVDEAEQ